MTHVTDHDCQVRVSSYLKLNFIKVMCWAASILKKVFKYFCGKDKNTYTIEVTEKD